MNKKYQLVSEAISGKETLKSIGDDVANFWGFNKQVRRQNRWKLNDLKQKLLGIKGQNKKIS